MKELTVRRKSRGRIFPPLQWEGNNLPTLWFVRLSEEIEQSVCQESWCPFQPSVGFSDLLLLHGSSVPEFIPFYSWIFKVSLWASFPFVCIMILFFSIMKKYFLKPPASFNRKLAITVLYSPGINFSDYLPSNFCFVCCMRFHSHQGNTNKSLSAKQQVFYSIFTLAQSLLNQVVFFLYYPDSWVII